MANSTKISLDAIKALRSKTGAGIHHVKEALEHSGGDVEKAVLYLREKGVAKAAKRSGNATNNGTIGVYLHGNTMGVMVELQCETDFAAKADKFRELAKEIAMHIAAQSPEYIEIADVPSDIIEREKSIYAKELEGKPEGVREKILEGKLGKFYEDMVLVEQAYIRDESKKIKDLINDYVAAIGESIRVAKFVKFTLGSEAVFAEVKSEEA